MRRFVLKLSVFCLLSFVFCVIGCRRNKAPDVKTPWGLPDDKGYVDTVYTFITDARDPEDEDVAFKFNWGDENESNWSSWITSGETYYIKHSYSIGDTYKVKAKAKDIHNNESHWSDEYIITITAKSAPPFNVTIEPLYDTATLGKVAEFKVCAIDTNTGDVIWYQCLWGGKEDTISIWMGPAPSGDTVALPHAWVDTSDVGLQEVRVRAKDQHGSVSAWSSPCSVIVKYPAPPAPPVKPILVDSTYSVWYWHTLFNFELSPVDSGIYYRFIWEDTSAWASREDLDPGPNIRWGVQLPHAFKKSGIHWVTAEAKDNYGQISDSSSAYEISITRNFITEWNAGSVPHGITVADYKLYVVDLYNHCIREFTALGGLLRVIGADILKSPMYVVGEYDYLYVADACDTVYKINRHDGTLVSKWGGHGTWDGRFDFPTGIAVDSNYVYVVDSQNKRVQKFTKDGDSVVGKWEVNDYSRGMCISCDTLFVACNFGNVIQVFNTMGDQLGEIGSGVGSGDGKLLGPCDVSVYGNYVYVADTDNHRVQVFTRDNKFVARWGYADTEDELPSTPGQFNKPQGIVVDASGYIYVVDTINNRVQKFEPVSKGGVL